LILGDATQGWDNSGRENLEENLQDPSPIPSNPLRFSLPVSFPGSALRMGQDPRKLTGWKKVKVWAFGHV